MELTHISQHLLRTTATFQSILWVEFTSQRGVASYPTPGRLPVAGYTRVSPDDRGILWALCISVFLYFCIFVFLYFLLYLCICAFDTLEYPQMIGVSCGPCGGPEIDPYGDDCPLLANQPTSGR